MERKVTQEVADHIDAVIEAIRAEELAKFDMGAWVNHCFEEDDLYCEHPCGTAACIGGFSDLIAVGKDRMLGLHGVEQDWPGKHATVERLGLSWEAAMRLFYCHYAPSVGMFQITSDMAITALEDIKRTGTFTSWDDYAHMRKAKEEKED